MFSKNGMSVRRNDQPTDARPLAVKASLTAVQAGVRVLHANLQSSTELIGLHVDSCERAPARRSYRNPSTIIKLLLPSPIAANRIVRRSGETVSPQFGRGTVASSRTRAVDRYSGTEAGSPSPSACC